MYGYGYQYGKISGGGGGGLPFTPPLDVYTGAAAAYSLRLLRSAYAGSAIRVRRSSDNAEQDIGFVSGSLDTASLLTFCGAGDGFVTTWYDQSGSSNDATQATAANQPKIVSSGSTLTENGKPKIVFDGTNDYMNFTDVNGSTFLISMVAGGTTKGRILGDKSSYSHFLQSGTTTNAIRVAGTIYNLSSRVLENQSVLSWNRVGTDNNIYENGSLNSNITSVSGASIWSALFVSLFDVSTCSDGYMQEFIVYSSNKTTSRADIETNLNSYYGVY